jgi:hypothetical protein
MMENVDERDLELKIAQIHSKKYGSIPKLARVFSNL